MNAEACFCMQDSFDFHTPLPQLWNGFQRGSCRINRNFWLPQASFFLLIFWKSFEDYLKSKPNPTSKDLNFWVSSWMLCRRLSFWAAQKVTGYHAFGFCSTLSLSDDLERNEKSGITLDPKCSYRLKVFFCGKVDVGLWIQNKTLQFLFEIKQKLSEEKKLVTDLFCF